jgi:hypothetical protein
MLVSIRRLLVETSPITQKNTAITFEQAPITRRNVEMTGSRGMSSIQKE